MSELELVHYEIAGSNWAGFISNSYLQSLAGKYYARKVKRKYRRYLKFKLLKKLISYEQLPNM